MNREAIFTALLNQLQNNATLSANIKTFGRRLKLWNALQDYQKPALYIVQTGSKYAYQGENLPALVTLQCKLLIYTYCDQEDTTIPATLMNTLLDAIDTALTPDPVTGKQTLGNTVTHCRIEGENLEDDGALDFDGVQIRNVSIFLPVTGV